jgi:hypothetical protein
MKKETTSPRVNILVNHLIDITGQRSPPTKRMILLRMIFIDAAKRVGATSKRIPCTMYGSRAQMSFAEMARPMYPTISTPPNIGDLLR